MKKNNRSIDDYEQVNKSQLAAIFNLDIRTISRWVQLGLPKTSKGMFSVPAAYAWRIEKAEFAEQVKKHPAVLTTLNPAVKGVSLPFKGGKISARLFVLFADEHLDTLFGQVGARDQPADSGTDDDRIVVELLLSRHITPRKTRSFS